MKSTLLAGALLVSSLAVTAPAGAQNAISVQITSPAPNTVAQGVIAVRATASSTAGIRRLELFVNGVSVARIERGLEDSKNQESIGYDWDTRHYPRSSQAAPNGGYSIRVEGVAQGGASRDQKSLQVVTDNAPQAPAGVHVTRQGQKATVAWSANPEPDLTGYRIERDSGAGFANVATVTTTSFTETLAPGEHSYRVVALRNSATSTSDKASAPSGAAAVSVPNPVYKGTGEGAAAKTQADGRTPASRSARARSGDPFTVGGKRIASRGLPGMALPGSAGLPALPESDRSPSWGTYTEQLPYGKAPRVLDPASMQPINVAARSPDRVIPPDGLRWVAAGLLLIVVAGLLMLMSRRIADAPQRETALTLEVLAGKA